MGSSPSPVSTVVLFDDVTVSMAAILDFCGGSLCGSLCGSLYKDVAHVAQSEPHQGLLCLGTKIFGFVDQFNLLVQIFRPT